MNTGAPIAVFDSGIGSYSIVRVLQRELPNENIIYLAERENFPYGGKTHDELKRLIDKTIRWFESTIRPKLIVIASNTPSIQVLPGIRMGHETSIIGVFPPAENAMQISRTKHIGILATKGAVESSEIDDFLRSKRFLSKNVVRKINASDLVSLVESGTFQTDERKTQEIIKSIIAKKKSHVVKLLVMRAEKICGVAIFFQDTGDTRELLICGVGI